MSASASPPPLLSWSTPATAVWTPRLAATAHHTLGALGPKIEAADVGGLVTGRSRFLCAALGALSHSCHLALGGRPEGEVAIAGAALSLLTKIDDQVIDGLDFHGGPDVPRPRVEARVRTFLAPTLASIRRGVPANGEPRCALAAELGVRLKRLAAGEPQRLVWLLEIIAEGWEIQAQAVGLFSRRPEDADPAEVLRVTAAISGLWLLMITAVGALPADARRALSAEEERTFLRWGAWIQRADALADLEKDLLDGLYASLPGIYAARAGLDWRAVAARAEDAYSALAAHDIDRAMAPSTEDLDALRRELRGLGGVPELLAWIHGFLTWRYLRHPLCQRHLDDPRFAPLVTWADDHRAYLHATAAALDAVEPRSAEVMPCSGR